MGERTKEALVAPEAPGEATAAYPILTMTQKTTAKISQ